MYEFLNKISGNGSGSSGGSGSTQCFKGPVPALILFSVLSFAAILIAVTADILACG